MLQGTPSGRDLRFGKQNNAQQLRAVVEDFQCFDRAGGGNERREGVKILPGHYSGGVVEEIEPLCRSICHVVLLIITMCIKIVHVIGQST